MNETPAPQLVPENALAMFANGGFWEGLRLYVLYRRGKLASDSIKAELWEGVLKNKGADAEMAMLSRIEEAVKTYEQKLAAQRPE